MLPMPSDMSLLDKMVLAVERVRDRLLRTARALDAAGIPYAIAGGNAVAAWVTTVDPAAVRNTQDVDILLRRADVDAAAGPLANAGFIRRHVAGIDVFLDGPDAKARDAVHVVIAGEKVRPEYDAPAPDVDASQRLSVEGGTDVQVLTLLALVTMKLTSFRLKDRVHILDLIDVRLIDASWVHRLASPLAVRLQTLLDNPDQ